MSGKFWDEAWSLVEGCTPVSEACDNCWLRSIEHRFGRTWDGKVTFRYDRLEVPIRKRKSTTFAIWSDLYHEQVPDERIMSALQNMYSPLLIPQGSPHTFLIITKRPERAAKFFARHKLSEGAAEHMDHIWHIVTVENQERADERIPHLLNIPGKRGLIIEPMLGRVDLNNIFITRSFSDEFFPGFAPVGGISHMDLMTLGAEHGIHQIILGPENGPGKRPMEESWAQAVEDQCRAAGVPFFRKDENRGQLAWRTK